MLFSSISLGASVLQCLLLFPGAPPLFYGWSQRSWWVNNWFEPESYWKAFHQPKENDPSGRGTYGCGKLLIHTELYKNPFVKILRTNTSPGKFSSRVFGWQEQPPSLGTNQKASPERWQIWNPLADASPGPTAQRGPFLLTQHWVWTHWEFVLAVREKPMWKI